MATAENHGETREETNLHKKRIQERRPEKKEPREETNPLRKKWERRK
jgi:hypothetical protein